MLAILIIISERGRIESWVEFSGGQSFFPPKHICHGYGFQSRAPPALLSPSPSPSAILSFLNILDPTKPLDQKPSKRCVYCWRNFCPLDFVPHDLIAIYNRSKKVVSFSWDRIYPTIVKMSWAFRCRVIS